MVSQFVSGRRDQETKARLILRRCQNLEESVNGARLSEIANKATKGSRSAGVFAVGNTRSTPQHQQTNRYDYGYHNQSYSVFRNNFGGRNNNSSGWSHAPAPPLERKNLNNSSGWGHASVSQQVRKNGYFEKRNLPKGNWGQYRQRTSGFPFSRNMSQLW